MTCCKWFLISLLLFNLSQIYNCTECFDFQCFDGGRKVNPNCFQCKNVSLVARNEWLSNLHKMIEISKRLRKYEVLVTLERKVRDGMYCCALREGLEYQTCSLIFSSGSKGGLPHYGMGCSEPHMWLPAICNNREIGSRCCRQNHCNGPNITELLYLDNVANLFHPNQIYNEDGDGVGDNKDGFKYWTIIISSIIFVCFVAIAVFCIVKIHKTNNNSRRYLPQNQNRHFYKKWHCILKLFQFLRGYSKRRKSVIIEDLTSYSESFIGHKKIKIDQMDLYDNLTCSGSGAGRPLMTKRTAATDITLIKAVGEGRFGTVWLGKWNGDNVAVKIFSTRDERSWDREKQIYQKNFLRHSNVLGYVATDSRDNGLATELWLVTDYHENGSLYEYLRCHVLTIEQGVKMIRSITNGLAYLHNEINGTEFKPGIAHRDIKSRNILVKSCGECCIGDLGLAVRLNEDCTAIDGNRVGTRRYMAPEVILDRIILSDLHYNGGLEIFKKADIYSYSLVLWEILRRCECPSMKIASSPYEMPYQGLVSSDPSVEEMRDVVCDKKQRPDMPASWDNVHPLKEISKAIRESWFEEPASRLSIMRLKKIMGCAWTEVQCLRTTILDISTDSTVLSRDLHKQHRHPPSNTANTNSTGTSEFPAAVSSLASSDIPNIVIRTRGNVLITDTYCHLGDNGDVDLSTADSRPS